MRSVQAMIAELEVIEWHARRAQLALQDTPPDWHDARTQITYILDTVPALVAIQADLRKKPPLPPSTPPT